MESVCDASEACIRALLQESPPSVSEAELSRPPALCAVEALQNTITCQVNFNIFIFHFYIFWSLKHLRRQKV